MSEGHTERLEAALAGRYRIERKLGEGGMASVYLAEDVKHRRNVALKILRPELAAVIGSERFLAEIQTTANLQHPHILPLFDSGEASGYLYYVMPYIDGETLRDKLDREKQLGVDEAVRIARDVADALDYAHRAGVIHRDIKPGNVLLHDGRPVVADFGIALAVSAAGGGRMTETGLSLGTPHYMSPEQASADRDLSPKSDVYSLGCVLYEMLAGQPPHTGPSAQSILVHILTEEAKPLTQLRHTVPPHVSAAVAKSIEKLPADRFESARDFMEALGDTGFTYQAAARPAGSATAATAAGLSPSAGAWQRGRRLTALGGSLTAAFFLAVLAAWGWLRPVPPTGLTDVARFALQMPDSLAIHVGGNAHDLAISPDGTFVIHQSQNPTSGYQLNLRRLDQLETATLRGPEDPAAPFFSFDGEWVGFVNASGATALQKVSIFGGPPVFLTNLTNGLRGADWGPDDVIVVGGQAAGLVAVPGGGGEPVALTTPAPGEQHTVPHLIAGRDAVVFMITGSAGALTEGRLAVLDRRSGEVTELGLTGVSPRYVSTGHIVYAVGDGSLRAVPFDVDALTVTGSPVPLVEGVGVKPTGSANFDISDNGTLVYASGGGGLGGAGLPLAVVDLDGNAEFLPLAPRSFTHTPVWSPDGRTVGFSSEGQIYTYDVVLNTTPRQITFEGDNRSLAFSPDGTRLAFGSSREGTDGPDIFVKELNEATAPRLLLTAPGIQSVRGWPTDSLIVYEAEAGLGVSDLWILDLSNPESPEARPYLTSDFDLGDIAVSPDGTLAAYRSNETGSNQIYLRSFPDPGERTIVSQDGGMVPFWSADGSTLYIDTGPRRPVVAARLQRGPVPLVLSIQSLVPNRAVARPYPGAVHPDGDRFILAVDGSTGEATPVETGSSGMTLVLNFFEEIRQRMGGN